MTFLVLGGTPAARDLAVRLQHAGIPVVAALLGGDRRHAPLPPVEVLEGSFGGAEGMAAFLTIRHVLGVIDASHPFSDVVHDALAATTAAGVPMVRLLPRSWEAQGGSDRWRWALDDDDAQRIGGLMGALRPFLSVGRDSLQAYTSWADRFVLARVPQLPPWRVPKPWEVVRSPEGHAYAPEYTLMSTRRVGLMVTRDTGGWLDEPKLRVAADLGVFVVMIRRPAQPAGVRQLRTVDDAYAWVARRWRPQDF